jgi:hypothetical protein
MGAVTMAEPLLGRRGRFIARWTARTLASGLVLLVAAIAVGHGLPNLSQATAPEALQFLAFAVILAGLLAGFRWEVLGGAAVLGGLAAFYAMNVAATGKVPGGAFPLFVIPGLLFLVSGLTSRAGRRTQAA